jgi:hypothetical protein
MNPATTRRSTALPCALSILIATATSAQADTVQISGSTVTLQPTTKPGALAEVEFRNDPTNSHKDNGIYFLDLNGLQIDAKFTWNVEGDKDRIDLTTPENIICSPDCSLTLSENDSGKIWLYHINSVGM